MNALVKNQRRSFAVVVLMCLQFFAAAQPAANFTASPQGGCSPLIVHFTDQSTGNPTQWKWDLGNGAVSSLKNPSATYFNPGTYTIKLVVKNATGADSIVKTNFITVHANPTVAFGVSDTSGCMPMAVQFTDSSLAGSGTISSWQWDFGDGTISSQQHPQHIYNAAGNYTVTLKVTNSKGCVKSVTKQQYIDVSAGVSASFNYSSPNICSAPATVQFNNTTAGAGNMSYQWNFGDGHTSTDADPVHTYTINGTYTVTLVATSTQGCVDSFQMQNLSIGTQQADFIAPVTACIGQAVTFTNISSPLPLNSKWIFSDGTVITSLHAVKTFHVAGTYTVKLVSNFGACKDSVTKQIIIAAKPTAAFTADATVFCKIPATVQFSSSTQALAQHWDFGDGQTSTAVNPSHTYTAEGNYTVKLVVTNAAGCTDTLIRPAYIVVKEPVIELLGLPQTGCAPLNVSPSANVTSSEPVQTWLWNFGDGTTSTAATPSHNYAAAGNYDVTLVITTASGCKDSVTMINGVRLGTKPKAEFYPQLPVVCNLYPVQFIDSSSGNPDQWYWDFGDGMSSTDQNPAHVYGDIGVYTVTLIVWNNTCADTITKQNVVTILPPISSFTVQHSCETKMVKQFTDYSTGATSWSWDFGDGTTSNLQNPAHTYAAPGEYLVTLSVSNGTCSNTNNAMVQVIDEYPTLLDTDVICKGQAEHFNAPYVNAPNIATWQWNFGDGSFSDQTAQVSHHYLDTGKFIVTLTITDLLGCQSTTVDSIRVFGPTAQFTPLSTVACLDGNQIGFTNTSFSDGLHPIQQWTWQYGDGVTQTNNNGANALHSYQAAGNYTVKLIVKDNYGCSDTASYQPVIISKPVASFFSNDTVSCTGKNIVFWTQSQGNGLSSFWEMGDGTTYTVKNAMHQYTSVGDYTVSLIITDKYGCKDTATRTDYVSISLPKAAFQISDSFGTCPPLMVHFTNNATGYTQFAWDFGDGNTSALLNPSHYYTAAGTYYPRLIVTGPGGCSDTSFRKVVVKGPSGNFSYDPLKGCNPLTVQFHMNVQNATSFVWDFSDGNTMPSQSQSISHTYTTAGDYIPRLILVDTAGCSVPVVGRDTIRVYGITAGFSLNMDSLCDAGSIQFANTSVSNDLIASYLWNFGDGSSSTQQTPSHHYNSVGSFNVQLIAATAHGCIDTVQLPGAVRVLEKPDVSITGLDEACMPASILFTGLVNKGNAPTLAWQWDMGNGNSTSVQHPDAQHYATDGTYTITALVTAANGCMDTAQHILTVHPLPATNAGVDVSICRGSDIQLQATGAAVFNWQQAASLDCINCPSPVATPTITTTYVVTGTNTFGCTQQDSVNVVVHQPFLLQATGNDTICAGEKVKLTASGADKYSWLPSIGIQDPHSASVTVTPSETGSYQVIATDSHNCFTDTATLFVKVWPIPTVSAGADLNVVVGDAVQLKSITSADVVSWQWTPAGSLSCATCPVTLAKPTRNTTYLVTVQNAGGCMARDNVTVNVTCNNGNLLIPNTFSPNGDGMNEQFYPFGKGINMIRSMRVYNRWGQLVFERTAFSPNNASDGWDGTFKGQVLPPDVYVYTMEVVCQNNEVLTYNGDVTLLR